MSKFVWWVTALQVVDKSFFLILNNLNILNIVQIFWILCTPDTEWESVCGEWLLGRKVVEKFYLILRPGTTGQSTERQAHFLNNSYKDIKSFLKAQFRQGLSKYFEYCANILDIVHSWHISSWKSCPRPNSSKENAALSSSSSLAGQLSQVDLWSQRKV